jgi:hypothetical protein
MHIKKREKEIGQSFRKGNLYSASWTFWTDCKWVRLAFQLFIRCIAADNALSVCVPCSLNLTVWLENCHSSYQHTWTWPSKFKFDNDFKIMRLYTGNQTGVGERSTLKETETGNFSGQRVSEVCLIAYSCKSIIEPYVTFDGNIGGQTAQAW